MSQSKKEVSKDENISRSSAVSLEKVPGTEVVKEEKVGSTSYTQVCTQ